MAKITVRFSLTSKGQASAMLAKKNSAKNQSIDLFDDDRDAVVPFATFLDNGDAQASISKPLDECPKDLGDIVALLEQQKVKAEAAKKETEERQKQIEAERTAEGERRTVMQAAEESAREKRLAEEKAKTAAEIAERDSWAERHGSDRLKRCIAEDIECGRLYRAERLAKELPGWRFYDDVPWQTHDPRNPTEDAFALLDEARAMLPEAYLQWVKREVVIDPEDYDSEVEVRKGYVAEGFFMGQRVVFGEPK
jgi:multidrug efflux pump subunit AcrA (membrane-fusion protein)